MILMACPEAARLEVRLMAFCLVDLTIIVCNIPIHLLLNFLEI